MHGPLRHHPLSSAAAQAARRWFNRQLIRLGVDPAKGPRSPRQWHDLRHDVELAYLRFILGARRVADGPQYLLDAHAAVSSRDASSALLSDQDFLTGLMNRHGLIEQLAQQVQRAQETGGTLAVCFLDLDSFKGVNEVFGHASGDKLLQTLAQRLRGALREGDCIARTGGDEFVVLLSPATHDAGLLAVAGKLLQAVQVPVDVQGRLCRVTASVGISRYPQDGEDASGLLVAADRAMHAAKAAGKNECRLFNGEQALGNVQEAEVALELALAIHRDELVLHYQPKHHARSGELVGLEALVRWQHPRHGLLQPGRFIDVAEQRGLAVELGAWVLRSACRQIGIWRARGLVPPPVAVNVSSRQFSDGALAAQVATLCEESGVEADMLELELTEGVLMEAPERTGTVLAGLRELGVSIAIDDFGTGYSSLAYLKRLRAQVVKVDRSFVSGLPHDKDDLEITRAVVALAHSLGLKVVAEGVENEAQRAALIDLGCDVLQGYLCGRPVPADQLVLPRA